MGPPPLVVVLCGGTSQRFGGGDKTAAVVDDASTTVLDRILLDLPEHWPVVCVGDRRPTARDVAWRREEPPLGGPVAGIAAGIGWGVEAEVVVVLAGDQPFAGRLADALVEDLMRQSSAEGVVAIMPDNFPQHLLGAYRTEALRHVVAGRANVSVKSTLGALALVTYPVDPSLAMDVDTPEDLARARRITRRD